jgi:hypothetical protein
MIFKKLIRIKKSIFAVVICVNKQINKFQKLINRPEMNCSMSIPPYFYFSKNILFDFPKQWFNFFVVDLVLTWEVLKGLSFVK